MPLTRLIVPVWLAGAVATVAFVLLLGWLLRMTRLPAAAVAAAQLLAWALCATAATDHPDALLGILPTPPVIRDLPLLLSLASQQLLEGIAPLHPGEALSFTLIAAAGLLALAVELLGRATRTPIAAAVPLIAAFIAPQLAVPRGADLLPAALLAAAVLWMAAADMRLREPRVARGALATGWAAALAAGAVVAGVVLAPFAPVALQGGSGVGATSRIDATLDLGSDLRRPAEVEVLRVRSDAGGAPYLRVATLTQFDGESWAPDEAPPDDLSFLPVDTSVGVMERVTTITVTGLTSEYLPVPYPAVEVTGTSGPWSVNAANRTIFTPSGSSLGQSYEVRSHVPQPTREEAQSAVRRSLGADGFRVTGVGDSAELSPEALLLPPDVPPQIRELAVEVTAGTDNAYDALVALQSWFRGGSFRYSLEAPVEDGFDGSGLDAIERFLDVRRGYCVHFASTFAVMARTLGLPARVVVGYLPGTRTGELIDDQAVYSVAGSQLHAWPEVHLRGIGWIPFEPTATLGAPTSFSPASAPREDDEPLITPSAAPTPASTSEAAPEREDVEGAAPEARGPGASSAPPVLGVVLAALIILAAPAAIRAVRWNRRLRAAGSGDAAAAWRELRALAIDAGMRLDESESPRAFGTRLVNDRGVPEDAVRPLVTGIERASFGPAEPREGWAAPATLGLSGALRRVRHALLPAGRTRLWATLAPRSLVARPRRR
ncbi:transglutaminase [Microbacterium album]|uniref:Transglutaminase n=1 Tax=Microbacterium album TaxID=2053191 RepID=A0A917MM94_9MICO|nr:transglutaminase [Microbacterium album]